MSDGKQAPTGNGEPAAGDGPVATESREKESGRVAFDSRGNPIWEWRTGDGQFQRDASTSLVRKLEAPDLRLEATAIVRKQDGAAKKPGLACGGFDPYDSGAAPAGPGRVAARPAAPVRTPERPAANAARDEPGPLQRLQAWLGGKRNSGTR